MSGPKVQNLEAVVEPMGEMPAQRFDEAVTIYCRWMVRLYRDRQEEQHDQPKLEVI